MTKMIFALIAGLAFATGAAAQDRMSVSQCQGSFDVLRTLVALPDPGVTVETDNEGWCLISGAEFALDDVSRVRLASLRWRGTDMDRFIAAGLPPRSFEVVGTGVGMAAQTGDPITDYVIQIQSAKSEFGFGLSVRWDGVQNAVIVDEAYVAFDAINRIDATARVTGVNLTDQASLQTSMGTAALTDVLITAQFAGWFELMAAPALASALLQRGDVPPEAQVTALKAQAVAALARVPETILPATSRIAIESFVATLPHPRGTARLQLSANPGLGATRMAGVVLLGRDAPLAQMMEVGLEGVSFLVTWTQVEGSQ